MRNNDVHNSFKILLEIVIKLILFIHTGIFLSYPRVRKGKLCDHFESSSFPIFQGKNIITERWTRFDICIVRLESLHKAYFDYSWNDTTHILNVYTHSWKAIRKIESESTSFRRTNKRKSAVSSAREVCVEWFFLLLELNVVGKS